MDLRNTDSSRLYLCPFLLSGCISFCMAVMNLSSEYNCVLSSVSPSSESSNMVANLGTPSTEPMRREFKVEGS